MVRARVLQGYMVSSFTDVGLVWMYTDRMYALFLGIALLQDRKSRYARVLLQLYKSLREHCRQSRDERTLCQSQQQ